MAYCKDLPGAARLLEVFQHYPRLYAPLIEFHQQLLRGDSPFTVAERELLAAYVSGVNSCRYCAGVHQATARRFGVEESTLSQLLDNLPAAPVPEKLKPVFRYARKLTESPARMTEADAAEVFAAGWDERALHDAVVICALFNCMNRIVDGLGISASPDYYQISSQRLASEAGYGALADILRHPPPPAAG